MTGPRHHRMRRLLDAFVDGELDPPTTERVRAHLRSCWWCSGDVQTLRLVKAALARRRATGRSLPLTRLSRFARGLPPP